MSAQPLIDDAARRHGFSAPAVQAALAALAHSGGGLAQFSHPEFGGMGQWMPGMIMIGDMFNNQLKARVDGLFSELARRHGEFLAATTPAAVAHAPPLGAGSPQTVAAPPIVGFAPAAPAGGSSSFNYAFSSAPITTWYPADLGLPGSSGSQNNFKYAFFPVTKRLAIELDGKLMIFDTADHEIGGVGQQQDSVGGRITFTSQHGTVDVSRLRRVV